MYRLLQSEGPSNLTLAPCIQVLKEVPGKGGKSGSTAIDNIMKMKQRLGPLGECAFVLSKVLAF